MNNKGRYDSIIFPMAQRNLGWDKVKRNALDLWTNRKDNTHVLTPACQVDIPK